MSTPLQRQLADETTAVRASALDAFKLARRKFLKGEVLDMQSLAAELGVGRTTLYRWTGSQEALLGEVFWSLGAPKLEEARSKVKGTGANYVAEVLGQMLWAIQTYSPLRRFMENDPEYALRFFASRESNLQARMVTSIKELLDEQAERGKLSLPAKEIESIAFAIQRICESFLFSDLIAGRKPAIDQAVRIIRALLRAPWD